MTAGLIKRLRRRAFNRQEGKCYWCKRDMIIRTKDNAADVWNNPRACTADHLILQAHGGETTRRNIVAACRECNNARHESAPMLDGTKPASDSAHITRWSADLTWLAAP